MRCYFKIAILFVCESQTRHRAKSNRKHDPDIKGSTSLGCFYLSLVSPSLIVSNLLNSRRRLIACAVFLLGTDMNELNNLKAQFAEVEAGLKEQDAQIAELRRENAELERAVADLNRQRVRYFCSSVNRLTADCVAR